MSERRQHESPPQPRASGAPIAVGLALVLAVLIGGFMIARWKPGDGPPGTSPISSPDSAAAPFVSPNPELEVRSEVQGDRIIVRDGPSARTNAKLVVEPGRHQLYVVGRVRADTLCSTTTDDLREGDIVCYYCFRRQFRACRSS